MGTDARPPPGDWLRTRMRVMRKPPVKLQVCQPQMWFGVPLDGSARRRELEPTFSIWSASRRSLASLRLGLNVSGSSSALIDVPCLELTSSLVVIYKNGTHMYIYKSNQNSLLSKRKSNIELYRDPQPAYRHELKVCKSTFLNDVELLV